MADSKKEKVRKDWLKQNQGIKNPDSEFEKFWEALNALVFVTDKLGEK